MNVAAAALFPSALLVSAFDDAISQEAIALRQTLDEAFTAQGSVVADRYDEISRRLWDAVHDASTNGVEATSDSRCRALAVMQSMPSHIPLPDVVVESDGEIGLDWDFGRRHVLSISVGEGPMLRYAALISAEPVHGRVPFAGDFPGTLSFFLDRLIVNR